MASCADLDCSGRKSVVEEAKLWATSLKDLLASNDGREEFKNYFDAIDEEDVVQTIEFWEKCVEVTNCYQKLKKTGRGDKHDSDEESKFISYSRGVFKKYVEGRLINFDAGQKKTMSDCFQGKDNKTIDPERIDRCFQEAKDWALALLIDDHMTFANYLIEKYKLVMK